MIKKDIEGFLREPFFVALKPVYKDSDTVESILKEAFNGVVRNDEYFYESLLRKYDYNNVKTIQGNLKIDYIAIIKQVVLEYLIQEDLLKYFCLEENCKQIVGYIGRKQINAKLVVEVTNRFAFVFSALQCDTTIFAYLLNNDIKRRIMKLEDDFIMKKYGSLKKIVDEVASGVKQECYLEFDSKYPSQQLSSELQSYIREKHGYELNISIPRGTSIQKVLSLALVNDENVWQLDSNGHFHCGKTIASFLLFVEENNDIKHAEKLVDYAFKEACKDPKIKLLYDNKLPFNLYDLEDEMISWCKNRFSVHLSNIINYEISDEECKGLIYPIYQGFDKEIERGKVVFEEFLKKAYPSDYAKMIELFSDVENVIQDESKLMDGITSRETTIRNMMEFVLLGYDDIKEKRKYLSLSYKDYDTNESVLKRFYYRVYLIDKWAKDNSYVCIYEYIYEMLKMIDKKYKFTSSYTNNTSLRDSKYEILKKILKDLGIDISDKFKILYIIALLDRKYATMDEASMFAELEQFGDAIYELAVDNILFYDPEFKVDLNHQERERYVKAESQMKVSKYFGFDKAYISELTESLNRKYDHNEEIYFGILPTYEGHFLADSLEMIIAVIAKDLGLQKALDFATKIIVEANSDKLTMPEFHKNSDIVELYNSGVDRKYLHKIFPDPFYDALDYKNEYHTLSYALNKLMKIYIYGNDTVEKRRKITNDLGVFRDKDGKLIDYYDIVVSYLWYGIDKTIDKYTNIMK